MKMTRFRLSGSVCYINHRFGNKTYHLFGDIHDLPGVFDGYNYVDNNFNKVIISEFNHQLDFFFLELANHFYENHRDLAFFIESAMVNIYENTYKEIRTSNVSKETKNLIRELRKESPLIWLRVLFSPFLNEEDHMYNPYVKFHNLDIRQRNIYENNIIIYIINYVKDNIIPYLDQNEQMDTYELSEDYTYLLDHIKDLWINNGDVYLKYLNNILFSDSYYADTLSIFKDSHLESLNIQFTHGPHIIREEISNVRKNNIIINSSNLADLLNSFFLNLYLQESIEYKISTWMSLYYQKFMDILSYGFILENDMKFLYDKTTSLIRTLIPLLNLEMDIYTLPKIFNTTSDHNIIYAGNYHINLYNEFFKNILGLQPIMEIINNDHDNILTIPINPFNLFES